jgi:hypothetical protein
MSPFLGKESSQPLDSLHAKLSLIVDVTPLKRTTSVAPRKDKADKG